MKLRDICLLSSYVTPHCKNYANLRCPGGSSMKNPIDYITLNNCSTEELMSWASWVINPPKNILKNTLTGVPLFNHASIP